MSTWINEMKESYPLIWFIVVFILIGLGFLSLHIVSNILLDSLSDFKRLRLLLFKNIILGLSIPIISMWFWFSSNENPLNEYQLIQNASFANGYISKIDIDSEEIEINDGRKTKIVDSYYYEFNFKLPNGIIVYGNGKEYGDVPDCYYEIDNLPCNVTVEYLSDNPKINRIKGTLKGNATLFEWFMHSIIIGIIVLLTSGYFAFLIIKNGLMKFRKEIDLI